MLALFIKGLMIGLAIAMPVGPIAILCIQRSLQDGFKIGLMTGLGAALADGTYGLVAAFGLTAVSSLLIAYQFWIRLLGVIFLLYLGVKLFRTVPRDRAAASDEHSSWHALATTFILTLANPTTILAFMAIFVGLGLGTEHHDYGSALTLVSGIIVGSAMWWLMLSSSVAFVLHHRLSPVIMRTINRLSGCIIFAFGIFIGVFTYVYH